MSLKGYNPKDIVLVVGAIIVKGFGEDTMVEVERDEDAFTKMVGADGETTRSKNANTTGQIRFTLAQTSESNQLLSALAALDEASGDGVVPVMVKDLGGASLAAAESGWVKKRPVMSFGKAAGTREWVIDTADLIINDAGN